MASQLEDEIKFIEEIKSKLDECAAQCMLSLLFSYFFAVVLVVYLGFVQSYVTGFTIRDIFVRFVNIILS